MHRLSLLVLIGVLTASATAETGPHTIWLTPSEILAIPITGSHATAWNNLVTAAALPLGTPNLSDLNSHVDVHTLAKALVYVRTGGMAGPNAAYRDQVRAAVMSAMFTECTECSDPWCDQPPGCTDPTETTLPLARGLCSYVIAAGLVGLSFSQNQFFRQWLSDVRYKCIGGSGPNCTGGRTLISTQEDRPNNHGTMAAASRAAADIYLGDTVDLALCAQVFRGYLGDTTAWDSFNFGSLCWQADQMEPLGINRMNTYIQGHPASGMLPDDQRRCADCGSCTENCPPVCCPPDCGNDVGAGFAWPPPHVTYVYEGLAGAIVAAQILSHAGYDAWNWEDQALLRAFNWLHGPEVNFMAEGDDRWQPWLVNYVYGTSFPASNPSNNHGKNMGWTDWTHCLCP